VNLPAMLNFGFMLTVLPHASGSRKKYMKFILYFFLLTGIISFFLPWVQLEFATGNAAVLPELAFETDGISNIMAYLVYAVYLIPMLFAWLFWSLMFDVFASMRLIIAVLHAIISFVILIVLYLQTLNPEIHLSLKSGIYLNGICSLAVLVILFWHSKKHEG
jgi:MFS family permease